MKPRMLWFCHSVALAISAVVAPCFRRRSSRTIAFLVSVRTSLAAAGRAAFLVTGLATTFRFFGVVTFDAFLVAGLAVFFLADARFVLTVVFESSVAVAASCSLFI